MKTKAAAVRPATKIDAMWDAVNAKLDKNFPALDAKTAATKKKPAAKKAERGSDLELAQAIAAVKAQKAKGAVGGTCIRKAAAVKKAAVKKAVKKVAAKKTAATTTITGESFIPGATFAFAPTAKRVAKPAAPKKLEAFKADGVTYYRLVAA